VNRGSLPSSHSIAVPQPYRRVHRLEPLGSPTVIHTYLVRCERTDASFHNLATHIGSATPIHVQELAETKGPRLDLDLAHRGVREVGRPRKTATGSRMGSCKVCVF
jgi:hypothetical protein